MFRATRLCLVELPLLTRNAYFWMAGRLSDLSSVCFWPARQRPLSSYKSQPGDQEIEGFRSLSTVSRLCAEYAA